MRSFWKILYTVILIPLLWVILRSMGFFVPKVRKGIKGRKTLFADLEQHVPRHPTSARVWFHASSLGEFEQAKPIIAELKRRSPGLQIVASFFSPSGYDHSRAYPLADVITYLPFDTPRNARRFLDFVNPDAAVMVRYDVWPNMIWELRKRRIPTMVANATMRRTSPRLLPVVRNFHYHLYNSIGDILTVSEEDMRAFQRFGLNGSRLEAIGDTRFDQVTARSQEARKRHILPEAVTAGKKVIVVGSSWPEDEEVIVPAFLEVRRRLHDCVLVIVPHEPTLDHLDEVERSFSGAIPTLRFSALNEYAGEEVILVDSIGILLVLYASADIAYIGGSFRQGIHNVLEAAVYGIPVLFGPRHRNSQEPGALVEAGGAFVVSDHVDLAQTLHRLLGDDAARHAAGAAAAEFVQRNTGATDRVLRHLEPYLQPGMLK
jgi:3-deoxy-D-manno-octulosonic-acid transferase